MKTEHEILPRSIVLYVLMFIMLITSLTINAQKYTSKLQYQEQIPTRELTANLNHIKLDIHGRYKYLSITLNDIEQNYNIIHTRSTNYSTTYTITNENDELQPFYIVLYKNKKQFNIVYRKYYILHCLI